MFLTGFDSKPLNTIYVDKNLKHHGLVQAYSRTNRTMGTKKSQGNVVAFRNLKPATDKAIELFANKDAQEEIILAPYEDYVEKFEEAVGSLAHSRYPWRVVLSRKPGTCVDAPCLASIICDLSAGSSIGRVLGL